MRTKGAVRTAAPTAYKRYARLPDDAAVKALQHEWEEAYGLQDAVMGLIKEIERGAQLVVGTYGGKRYCLLYHLKPQEPGWPNAVTGWGTSAAQAVVNLSFKWLGLMQETWDPQRHAPLVSEGGIRR